MQPSPRATTPESRVRVPGPWMDRCRNVSPDGHRQERGCGQPVDACGGIPLASRPVPTGHETPPAYPQRKGRVKEALTRYCPIALLLHFVLAPRDVVHSEKQNQAQHTPISASAWLRIGQLFEAALARPLEERASYLEKNCSEEPEICWEVLSLLKSAETAGSFLDNPATAWSAQRLTLEHGNKLGQFEILEVIGRGGMGDVYRARDLRLQREVALKVLPQAFACDPERVLRFEREAKAAGSLSHSNVVHIYEVGRTDGNWWIAS